MRLSKKLFIRSNRDPKQWSARWAHW